MALPTTYRVGTVTVPANGTAVAGVGTNWLAGGIREGDRFAVNGLSVTIASVESATQITLSEPWTGEALAASPYEIRYTPDSSRVLAASRAALVAVEETYEASASAISKAQLRKNNAAASRAPLPSDDTAQGYEVGSRWVHEGLEWLASSVVPGAAVWTPLKRGEFASRAAAQASRIPTPVTRIEVRHGGITLAYVADTNGTALTTADGRSWSPDGDAWPEHFGAVVGAVSAAIDDALQRWKAYISSDTRAVTGRLQAGSYRHTRPIVWGNVRNLTLVGEGGNINNGGSRIEYYGTVADAPEGAVVLKSVLHAGLSGISFINRCPNLPLHFVVGANPGPALSTHFIDISRCGFYDGATGSVTSAGVEIAATKFLRFAQNQVSYNGAVGLRLGNDDDSTIIAGALAVSEIEQNMIFNDLELVHVHSAQLNENSFETRSIGGAGCVTIGGRGRVSSVKVNGGAFIDDAALRTETRPAIATPTYDGTTNLSPGSSFVVEGVMFRDRPVGVHIRGGGVSVDACRFMLRNLVPGAVGIRIDDGADNARPIHIGTENDFTLAFRNGMTAIEDNRQNLSGSVIFNSKLATDFTFANVGSMETVITGQPKRPLRGGNYRITVQATILVSSSGGGRYEAEVVVGGVNLGMFCRENGENSGYLTLTGSQIVRLNPTTAASQAVVNFRIRQASGAASMVRGAAQGLTIVQIEELP